MNSRLLSGAAVSILSAPVYSFVMNHHPFWFESVRQTPIFCIPAATPETLFLEIVKIINAEFTADVRIHSGLDSERR